MNAVWEPSIEFMKEIVRNIVLFISLCLVFSMLTSCTGTGASVGNTNTANVPSTESKSSSYPPLASGLAEADFELLDGTKFKVSEKKGKVLLLNIWGTWCGPCREEMPHLVAMQNEYAAKGLEVIGLNIGDGSGTPEGVDQIKAFVEKMKLNYTIARSPNASTMQFYQISKQQVVPQTLLVDRDGHLRGVFVGGGQRVIDSMKNTLAKTMEGSENYVAPEPNATEPAKQPMPDLSTPSPQSPEKSKDGKVSSEKKPSGKE